MPKRFIISLLILLVTLTPIVSCGDDSDTSELERRAAQAEAKVSELQQRIEDLQAKLESITHEVRAVIKEVPIEKIIEVEKEVISEVPTGVTQEEYDKTLAKLESLNTKLQLCQTELNNPKNTTATPQGSFAVNGIAYGPFRDGQNPDFGIYPTIQEIHEDLVQIKSIATRIRTYGCSDSLYHIPQEASHLGISVSQGIFLGKNAAQNEREIRSAIDLANRGLVESLIVGNETLLAGTLSLSELTNYISRVKQDVPSNVTVTTSEPWSIWRDNPSLIDEVDYLLVHVHPFWEGVLIEDAANYVITKYKEIQSISGGKEVVIGETGWPSSGNEKCSEENLRRFIEKFTRLSHSNSVLYYYFSAYDEEWKWGESVSQSADDSHLPLNRTLSGCFPGSSWGIFYSNGQIKSGLASMFPCVETSTSRSTRVIFDERGLSAFYDMGVDSSHKKRDWLELTEEGMQMAYPASQSWGTVFITVGTPVDSPRPWKDFSEYSTLAVDLRGEVGGESLEIGIKDASDPDTGRETKLLVSNLSKAWHTYEFPLISFNTAELDHLYVVIEFVFAGASPETVYFKNVRYIP